MHIFKYVVILSVLVFLSGCTTWGVYPGGSYYVDSDSPEAKKAYKKEIAKIKKRKKKERERIAKCMAKNQAMIDEGLRPRHNCRRRYYSNSYYYEYISPYHSHHSYGY